MSRVVVAVAVFAAGIATSVDALAKCKDPGEPIGASCRRFAENWEDNSAFAVFFGPRSLSFRRTARFDGSAGVPFTFPGSALDGGPLRSYGGYFGLSWAPSPYLYFGAEVAAGEGSYHSTPIRAQGVSLAVDDSLNALQIQGGALLGLRLPLGDLSIRAEVLGGGQSVSLSMLASPAATPATLASATAWLVEPRVALDVWATPFMTISAFAGMPDGNPHATNAGLAFTGHLRAFDGKYSLF